MLTQYEREKVDFIKELILKDIQSSKLPYDNIANNLITYNNIAESNLSILYKAIVELQGDFSYVSRNTYFQALKANLELYFPLSTQQQRSQDAKLF